MNLALTILATILVSCLVVALLAMCLMGVFGRRDKP
jgi:hypothetical protein